jgi:hypothetical protein
MRWSAGSTIIVAVGARAAIQPTPRAMAGAVSRFSGSAMMFSFGRSGEHEDVFLWNQSLEALDGQLQEGLVPKELEQLLGQGVAAHWPESLAASSGEDQGISWIG